MSGFFQTPLLICVMLTCVCARAHELTQPGNYAKVSKSGPDAPQGRHANVQGMWLPSELVAAYNARKHNETARALNVYPQANTQKPTRMDSVAERKYYPNYSLSSMKQAYSSTEQQDKGLARGEAQDRFFPGQYTPFFGNKNKGYPPAGPPMPAAAAAPQGPMYLPPPPNTYGPPQGDAGTFTAPSSSATAEAPPPVMLPEPSPAMSPPEMTAPQTYMAPPPMSAEDNHDHDHSHHHPPSAPMSAPMSAPSAPAPVKEDHDNDHGHHHHHEDTIKYAPLGEHEYYTPPPGYEHHEHHDHGYAFHDHHDDYEDYHHDHVEPPPPTMPPEMLKEEMRDTDKYSYYYIGRKLWYIPLYFSIYFIIYIAIVILKSIARHRIQYPTHYKTARSVSPDGDSTRDLAVYVSRMLSEAHEKYAQ